MNKKTKLIGAILPLFVSLFVASCAQDGFDEESWSSSVRDQVLQSPASDAIVADKNADGSSWIITWPLVKGAGGFKCTVKDVTDKAKEPVVIFQDSIVDGCSLTFPRAEDTFYELEILALGKQELNNQDATESSIFAFNSFVPTWKTVPAGSDIATWLAANPIPDDYEGDVCINLEPGASYTMSDVVDFGSHQGTIRSTVVTSPANIKFTGGKAGFVVADGFTMKNLNIDCSESQASLVTMSSNMKESLLVKSTYLVTEPIYMKNCTVENLHGRFLHDNGLKYCAKTVIIDNSLIHLESTITSPFIDFYNGGNHVNDLTLRNSTFWDTGSVDREYFVRYNNAGQCGNVNLGSNSISYTNCTFYNIAKTKQLGNYDGIAGKATSYFTLKECVFVDCSGNVQDGTVSPGGVVRYFLSRKTSSNAVFRNNTYCFNGADMDVNGWDNTGTAILGNPGFTNPTGNVKTADFHMSGAAQNSAKIGDPRWLN